MVKPYVEVEVRGKKILRIDVPFDVALNSLRSEGIQKPLTSEELVSARIYHPKGKESSLVTRGSYTCAGFVYLKGEKPIRAPDSPLLNASLAKKVTRANRNGRYFVIDNAEMYEVHAKLAKDDENKKPEKRRAIVLPSRDSFQISATENPEVFANIFGKAGKKYLEFLGFEHLTVCLVDKGIVDAQNGTILTQEWLARLDCGSNVNGDGRGLTFGCTVRGVQLVTGEASSQKPSKLVQPYTTKDLRAAKKELTRLSEILQPNQFSNLRGLVSKLRGN